jgi:hypothetical protein
MRRAAPPDGEDGGETVDAPGPGSCGAGSDPDEETGREFITAPEGAGVTPGDQEDCERPTSRAMLVITLRQISAADWHTEG